MSNEKKTVKTEEVKEEVRKLSVEELEQVTGGSLPPIEDLLLSSDPSSTCAF